MAYSAADMDAVSALPLHRPAALSSGCRSADFDHQGMEDASPFDSYGRRWAEDGARREAGRLRLIGYSQARAEPCPVGSACEPHWHVRPGPRQRQDSSRHQPRRHGRRR